MARMSASARRGRGRRRGWSGWLGRLLLLALAWLLGVAGWIVWVGQRDQAAQADAIIVLGAAAYHKNPSPVFKERINHGLDLYRRGYAPVLLFTGGYGNGAPFAESQVARKYALQQGIPDSAIMIEAVSRNTRENLLQARKLMQERGLHRVIVVSDPLHMSRALRLSRELGIDAVGSPTPSTRFRTVHTQWRFLLQEVYFFHRDLVVRVA
ncbi:protein sanA-like protein [Pseudoxanthomonas kaohsiungensis]|nr:protein sanA-like protein [Pseudoxanthomonas kaohsiungensis]